MKYLKLNKEYFEKEFGLKFGYASLNENLDSIKRKILESDALYFPGGLLSILIFNIYYLILRRGILDVLKECDKILVGNSAGALVFLHIMIVTKDEDHPETKICEGLGLVRGFTIEVHYDKSKDEELKMLSRLLAIPIYAIPERTALIYENRKLKTVGAEDIKIFGNSKI